jgi:hypothetical protein
LALELLLSMLTLLLLLLSEVLLVLLLLLLLAAVAAVYRAAMRISSWTAHAPPTAPPSLSFAWGVPEAAASDDDDDNDEYDGGDGGDSGDSSSVRESQMAPRSVHEAVLGVRAGVAATSSPRDGAAAKMAVIASNVDISVSSVGDCGGGGPPVTPAGDAAAAAAAAAPAGSSIPGSW